MKITSVDVRMVTLPLKEPTVMAAVTLEEINSIFVTVTLENGVVGYGEAGMGPTLYADTPETTALMIRRYFGPALLGQSIEGLDRLDAVMSATKHHGHVCARGAIDLALHDALGKLYGVPVASLLGGAHKTDFEMVGWIGLLSPEGAATKAKDQLKEGYRWFKLKVGGRFDEDVARVAAVREALGSGPRLRLDANGSYSPQDAVRMAWRIADYDIEFLEDPVPEDAWFNFADLRGRSPIPICADGAIRSPRDAARILSSGAADMLKVKLIRAGGLVRARKIMSLAEIFSVPVVVGRSTTGDVEAAAQMHLACASPNAWGGGEFVGSSKAAAHLVKEPLEIRDGSYDLPPGPGFGVEVLEDALERFDVPLTV